MTRRSFMIGFIGAMDVEINGLVSAMEIQEEKKTEKQKPAEAGFFRFYYIFSGASKPRM